MNPRPPDPIDPHPDFSGRAIPREIELGPFRLTMLTTADLDEDLAAIEESAAALDNMFGSGWPRGLTREQNRMDLARHQREFIARIAFAWVIRNRGGDYLGCAYVTPRAGQRGVATAAHWMRSTAAEHGPAFAALFHEWLRGPAWPTLELSVISRP